MSDLHHLATTNPVWRLQALLADIRARGEYVKGDIERVEEAIRIRWEMDLESAGGAK